MPTIKRINHIAILVDDLEKNLFFWRDVLGMELIFLGDVPAEQAEIAFLPVGDSEIELVKPTSDDSGLARYLAKHGPGLHHICLEVDDIQGMLTRLKEKGIQLIHETPAINLAGIKYVFIHPKSANGVLVELYELPKEA